MSLSFRSTNHPRRKTEEEKKIISALLGKLYVSPASSEAKSREVYAVVCDAVDNQLLSDTASRNALYKIHVSLGKIVNTLDAAVEAAGAAGGKYRRSVSRASSVGFDAPGTSARPTPSEERTVVPQHEVQIKEEEEDSDAGTVVHRSVEEQSREQSLVDELLS